ncbi:MAG: DUF2922 domain-containing protein [Synergistaceae bacterium]|nr:DUF2922 domain-containing protein [Synergistaceae bacterium]
MAVINKLSLTFGTSTGTNTTLSFKYAKSNITATQVKALMNGIIANNVLWSSVPTVAKGAKLIQTEETAIDISE